MWVRVAALGIVLTPAIASAQRAARIEYTAPEECPPAERVQAQLDEALARAPDTTLPHVEASIEIRRAGSGAFEGEVRLREGDHHTQRALSDPSCEVIADAAALIVVIAMVPGLELGASDEAEPASAIPPTEQAPSEHIIGGALRLSAHVGMGSLPGVVVGGELAGALRIDALRVELAVRGVPLVGARFAVDPALGGDLGLVVGLARTLGVLVLDPQLELMAGAGVELGAALGRAVGISDPRDTAAPWLALEAAVGIAWIPWPALALFLEVEALVPIVRPVFRVGGLGVLHRPEPIAGALRIGIELRFP